MSLVVGGGRRGGYDSSPMIDEEHVRLACEAEG